MKNKVFTEGVKRKWGQWIAMLLVVTMTITMMPGSAFTGDGQDEQKTAARIAMEKEYGEEKGAALYAEMQNMGLISESGMTKQYSFEVGNKEYSLEDMKTGIQTGSINKASEIRVDGEKVAFSNVERMLEYKEYVSFIDQNFGRSDVAYSEKHYDNFEQLSNQLSEQGISVQPEEGTGSKKAVAADNGWMQDLVVKVTSQEDTQEKKSITFTLYRGSKEYTGDLPRAVTFQYKTYGGAGIQNVTSDSGTVTFSGTAEPQTVSLSVPNTSDNSQKKNRYNNFRAYYLRCYNLSNALFENGNTWMTKTFTAYKSYDLTGYQYVNIYPWKSCFLSNDSAGAFFNYTDQVRYAYLDQIASHLSMRLIIDCLQYESESDPSSPYYVSLDLGVIAGDYIQKEATKTYPLSILGPYTANKYFYGVLGDGTTTESGKNTKHEFDFTEEQRTSMEQGKEPQIYYCVTSRKGRDIQISGSVAWYLNAGDDTLRYAGLSDNAAPKVRDITVSNQAYCKGETIPITVQFNEPVKAANQKMTIQYKAGENGAKTVTKTITPTAKELTSTSSYITYEMAMPDDWYSDSDMVVTKIEGAVDSSDIAQIAYQPSGGKSLSFDRGTSQRDSFSSISFDKTVYKAGYSDNINATINLNTDYPREQQNQWLVTQSDSTGTLSKVYASIDNGATKIPVKINADASKLTASFPAPVNADETTNKTYQFDLFVKESNGVDSVIMNRYGTFEVEPVEYVDASKISYGYPTSYPSGEEKVLYLGQEGEVKLSYNYSGSGTYIEKNDFEWKSSDEAVAVIDADGYITPQGVGTTTFYINALNRGYRTTKAANTVSFTVKAGGKPGIVVTKGRATYHKDAKIYWNTNIIYKNQHDIQPATNSSFKVELYEGNYSSMSELPTEPKRILYSKDNEAQVTISGGAIEAVSKDETTPAYTVRVSSVWPGDESQKVEALGYIVVDMPPAEVHFTGTNDNFVSDEQSMKTVEWKFENIDKSNGYDMKLWVTKNGAAYGSVVTGSALSYNVPIENITSDLKEEYVVTIEVKNKKDTEWSYDSHIITAYNAESMKLLVDGTNQSDIVLSNRNKMKDKSSAEILALKRQIFLTKPIAMNAKEQNYSIVFDRFNWSSEDNDIANVNVSKKGRYINVSEDKDASGNESVVSYPASKEFVLSGIGEGTTKITATHKFTEIKKTLNTKVESLRDRLYLIQANPKAKTKLTYQNGDGAEKTVDTDTDGSVAIYEESGIASDINMICTTGNEKYLGTYYQYNLKSGEGNEAKGELYPVNNAKLRKVSNVKFHFAKPDGSSYTGTVKIRGGVYKNGHYCETSEISDKDSAIPTMQETPNANGDVTLTMDSTRFWSAEAGESSAAELTGEDKLEYVFEVEFAYNNYVPQLVKFNANMSEEESIEFGESNIRLIATKTMNRPYLVSHKLNRYKSNGSKDNLFSETGTIGISPQTKKINIESTVMWWGTSTTDIQGTISFFNEKKELLNGQKYKTHVYPFGTMPVTESEVLIDEDSIWLDDGKSGSINYSIMNSNQDTIESKDMPYKVRNMIHLQNITSSGEFNGNVSKELEQQVKSKAADSPVADNFIGKGMAKLAGTEFIGDKFTMMVAATKDPAVFSAVINMHVGSDVTANEFPKDTYSLMAIDEDADTYTKFKQTSTLALKSMKEDANQIYNDLKKKRTKTTYEAGGCFTANIEYNFESKEWEVHPKSGTVLVGLGMSYSWSKNAAVGPIPVTAEFQLGAAVKLQLDANYISEEARVDGTQYMWKENTTMGTDYLTNLKLYAYLYAFGGVGFDFTIVALKIGVFGEIEFLNENKFLTREYLKNSSDRKLKGQAITLKGQTGIRFVAKFLFISYQKTLASASFSKTWTYQNWDKITDYWEAMTGEAITEQTSQAAAQAYANKSGTKMMEVEEEPVIEERNYLEEYDRVWNDDCDADVKDSVVSSMASGKAKKTAKVITGGAVAQVVSGSILQSNTYPYANPMISDDGKVMTFLSDNNSTSTWDTTVHFAKKNADGTYEDDGSVDTGKYGDSQLSMDGDGAFAVATWARVYEKPEKDAGDTIGENDFTAISNATEVMAGIYDGDTFNTVRLTDNETPDMAPVVATNGEKAVIVWRSVYASDASNPTAFTEKDTILYKVYSGGSWGETKALYNGTLGSVVGMNVEMLDDSAGTFAVAYTMDTGGKGESQDYDIAYTVADASGIVNNMRLTKDSYMDENPQITTVNMSDGAPASFLIGWHHQENESDIRLASVHKDGTKQMDFVDSLSEISESTNDTIGSNFKFCKNTKSHQNIAEQSILYTARDTETSTDSLYRVSFGKKSGTFYTSMATEIGKMQNKTVIDHFDAYLKNSGKKEIATVILGTTYLDETETVTGTDGNGEESEIPVPKSTTNMYLAGCTVGNTAEVSSPSFDLADLTCGAEMPVTFTVTNTGEEILTGAAITIDGKTKKYSGYEIYPGQSQNITAYYQVPEYIKNVDYEVSGYFGEEAVSIGKGSVTLAVPDVGIGEITNTEEVRGWRTYCVNLYQGNEVDLTNRNYKIKLALYSSSKYDNAPLAAVTLYGLTGRTYQANLRFSIKDVLTTDGIEEIPEEGMPFYLKCWIEDENDTVVKECDNGNNTSTITCENLKKKNHGQSVKVESQVVWNEGTTMGTVTVYNMSMQAAAYEGDVIAYLYDEAGNIIETRKWSESLNPFMTMPITLDGEGIDERDFYFSKKGVRIDAVYYPLNPTPTDNIEMIQVSDGNLIFDKNQTEYTMNTIGCGQTTMTAVAGLDTTRITIADATGRIVASGAGIVVENVSLANGENEFYIKADGGDKEYKVTIQNAQTEAEIACDVTEEISKGTDGLNHEKKTVTFRKASLAGFTPKKLEYSINGGEWQQVAYEDKDTLKIKEFTEEGAYHVVARLTDADGYIKMTAPVLFTVSSYQPVSVPTPTPSPTPTSAPTGTPTPTPSPTPTLTPVPINTPTPSGAQSPTPTGNITPSSNPTGLPTVTTPPVDELQPTPSPTDIKPGVQTALWGTGKSKTIGALIYKNLGKNKVSVVRAKNKKAKSVSIPGSVKYQGGTWKVTKIDKKAFYKMKKLQKVVIGKEIAAIGANAFAGCKKLKQVIVKSTKVKKVDKKAFTGANKKWKLVCSKKNKKSYKKLFKR